MALCPFFQCALWQLWLQYATSLQIEQRFRSPPSTPDRWVGALAPLSVYTHAAALHVSVGRSPVRLAASLRIPHVAPGGSDAAGNIIIGGAFGDIIIGGSGNDVILGDGGEVLRDGSMAQHFARRRSMAIFRCGTCRK